MLSGKQGRECGGRTGRVATRMGQPPGGHGRPQDRRQVADCLGRLAGGASVMGGAVPFPPTRQRPRRHPVNKGVYVGLIGVLGG